MVQDIIEIIKYQIQTRAHQNGIHKWTFGPHKWTFKASYEIVHQYMLTNSVQISCVTETNKQNTEVPDFPG